MNFFYEKTTGNSSSTPVRIVSPNEVVKAETVDTYKELIESIDKMILAISHNQSVQTTAKYLANKGWWSTFTGTVSGANDKDIATMVKNLGGSLETTQSVVQVMLRLQTQKLHLLREFHSVLVDKIIKIQNDTQTLDGNQRSAAYEIVSALKDQVEHQMRQSETVDRHELQMKKIDDILMQAASVELDFREQLRTLDDHCASLKKSDGYLSCEVEALQVSLKELTSKSATNLAEVENQTHSIQAELRNVTTGLRQEATSATGALSVRIDQQIALIAALEVRLSRIETELVRSSTWSARLLRHSFGLAGTLIAITGLALSLRM